MAKIIKDFRHFQVQSFLIGKRRMSPFIIHGYDTYVKNETKYELKPNRVLKVLK